MIDTADRETPVAAPRTRWRPSRYQLGLGAVAALALAVRWVQTLVVRPECGPDGEGPPGCVAILGGVNDPLYLHLQANAITDGHWFVDPLWLRSTGESVASAGKPPLYPLFLGVVSWFGGSSITAHRLASGVAGVVAVLLIAYAAKLIAGRRAGSTAGAFAAVYPMFWVNDILLQNESLYAGAAAVCVIAGYRFWRSPTFREALLVGGAVALATLTRAEAALLMPFMVAPLAWRSRDDLKGRAALFGVAAGAAALVVAPWALWNLARFDEPTLLSTSAGSVLSAASCDQTYYGDQIGYYGDCFRLRQVPESTQRDMCRRIALPADCFADPDEFAQIADSLQDRHVYDESERQQVASAQATAYIANHKSRLPVVMAARVGRMWDVFRPAQNVRFNWQLEARGERASQAGLLLYYALVPFAVLGGVALRRRQLPLSPLIAPMVVITITAALFFGTTRYRVPADVALVILAAVGAEVLLRRRWPRTDDGLIDGDRT